MEYLNIAPTILLLPIAVLGVGYSIYRFMKRNVESITMEEVTQTLSIAKQVIIENNNNLDIIDNTVNQERFELVEAYILVSQDMNNKAIKALELTLAQCNSFEDAAFINLPPIVTLTLSMIMLAAFVSYFDR